MNREQQSILRVYALVVVVMTMVVPWRQYGSLGNSVNNFALGYAFIFAPPSAPDRNVDIPRWAVSMVGLTLAAGALTLARATSRPGGTSR